MKTLIIKKTKYLSKKTLPGEFSTKPKSNNPLEINSH